MKKWIITVIGIIVLVAIIALMVLAAKKSAAKASSTPEGIFASCLKDSGTKFYGAAWCPHCLSQKALFKQGYKQLPYVECSPQRGTLLPVCETAKIESFPTWDFQDGTRKTGSLTIAELALGSSCPIPVELESIKDKKPE